MEFPTKPTKRQRERQQAIASVISGIAYNAEIDPVYTMQEYTTPQLPSDEPGFNWQTFIQHVKDGQDE